MNTYLLHLHHTHERILSLLTRPWLKVASKYLISIVIINENWRELFTQGIAVATVLYESYYCLYNDDAWSDRRHESGLMLNPTNSMFDEIYFVCIKKQQEEKINATQWHKFSLFKPFKHVRSLTLGLQKKKSAQLHSFGQVAHQRFIRLRAGIQQLRGSQGEGLRRSQRERCVRWWTWHRGGLVNVCACVCSNFCEKILNENYILYWILACVCLRVGCQREINNTCESAI